MPVAPHGLGAAVSQLRGADWHLTLAPSWPASDDGDCISIALSVTYNCAEADRGIEDAEVDRMLGSLSARSDHG